MTKKTFFLLSATTVVLLASALISCEKDIYMESEIEEKFFKIVDENHINTYDQLGVLCEENKEVSFSIKPQYDLFSLDTLYAATDETLERSLSFGELSDDAVVENESILYEFHYSCGISSDGSEIVLQNKIRILGMLQESKSSTEQEKDYLYCSSDVRLTATIMPRKQDIIKVLYQLKCDNLVLASAEQIFKIEL